MKTTEYMVTLTFTEPLLGSVPMDTQGVGFVIGNAPDLEKAKQERQTAPIEDDEEEEPTPFKRTGFHRQAGEPFLYDYVIKGFFKEACSDLRRDKKTEALSLRFSAHRKHINGLVFIYPRRLYLRLPKGGEISETLHPLRASTPRGERQTIVQSEFAPEGTTIEFKVEVLGERVGMDLLNEWFTHGKRKGLGQWRGGSWGRFTYTLREVKESKRRPPSLARRKRPEAEIVEFTDAVAELG